MNCAQPRHCRWTRNRFYVLWPVSFGVFILVAICLVRFAKFLSAQDVRGSTLNIHPKPATGKGSFHKNFLYPATWNALMVLLFMVQHTGMTSCYWKDLLAYLQCFDLHSLSRSVYIVASGLVLELIRKFWSPLKADSYLWFLDTSCSTGAWSFFFLVHVLAWAVIVICSVVYFDWMELMGLKQVHFEYCGLRDPMLCKSDPERRLLTNMRHPGTTSFLFILWVHPIMTLQRLQLSLALTLYVFLAFSVDCYDYAFVKRQVLHNHPITTCSSSVQRRQCYDKWDE